MRIGFAGLGQMGRPIAANLARGGDAVVVWDRREEARVDLAAQGLVAAASPAELAESEVVFLCLPDGEAVEDLLFGSGGLAARMERGRIVVDLSTIAYAKAVALAQACEGRGLRFLDAPISGMPARAKDGTLTVMCGGDAGTFAAAEPLLRRIGTTILHMGPAGSGQLTKTINNLLYDINIAALAEVLPMAVRMGLDPVQIGEVVTTGTSRSFASEFFVPRILAGRFDEGYPLESAYKDLVSAARVGAEHGIPLPVTAAATATYQTALRQGHGAKDKGAMILAFEALLGVAVRAPRPGNGRKPDPA